jgi:hypothetical protein
MEDWNYYNHINELRMLKSSIDGMVELKENDLKKAFSTAISLIDHLLTKIEQIEQLNLPQMTSKVEAIGKDHEECYFCKLSK